MTVMGEVLMKGLSDAGSIPARSILLEIDWPYFVNEYG